MNFKNGDRVTCTIHGTTITNARISIDENGMPFICQNEKNGGITDDKLGYEYSWILSRDFTDPSVEDLKLATPTWNFLAWKDIILDSGGDRRMVLAVLNEAVLISQVNDFEVGSVWYLKKELQKRGYTIEGEVPAVEEITVAEAEARFGVKIKKELSFAYQRETFKDNT